MPRRPQQNRNRTLFRIAVEIAFIVFLFYANLVMGDFTRRAGVHHTLGYALRDVFTLQTAVIALVSATVGFLAIEYLRRR